MQKRLVRKLDLEKALSKIDHHPTPEAYLEQYTIPSDVAAEILIGNRTVRDFIEQGKGFKEITKLIEEGADQYGMQTFDQSLFNLYKAGLITPQVALQNSTSPRDLKLRIQGLRTT